VEALGANVRLGVVSNNVLSEQEAKLEALDLRRFFDAVVVSAEEGISKPDPAIFDAAMSRLGVTRDAAVMVGDSWASDIVGAAGVGMRAVWLNRRAEACPDPAMATEIRSLEPTSAVTSIVLDGRAPARPRSNRGV
jgi:putative hydrolase of the HAD superfamily